MNQWLEEQKTLAEDPPQNEEGEPIEYQEKWEKDLLKSLNEGQRVSTENMLNLMKKQVAKQKLDLKGFVFELPCYENPGKD